MNAALPLLRAVASAPVQPWRNGGGRTRELLRWPEGASDADWQLRVSVADIEQDGPFSAFGGVWRGFAVLSGAGVVLQAAGHPAQTLTPASPPLHFDGALAPDCRLIAGPTRDLNLMSRNAGAALIPAQAGVPWQPGGGGRGLFTTRALRLHLGAGATLNLPAWHLAWAWVDADAPAWSCSAPDTLEAVDAVHAGPPVAPAFWLYHPLEADDAQP